MSYVTQNLSLGGLRFGGDQLSQLLMRSAKNGLEPLQYDSLQRVPLPNDTLFQILQITDVTRSLGQELEYLNEFEDEMNVVTDKVSKGKVRKKNKVITSVELDSDQQQQQIATTPTRTIYKMLLQDSFGNLCYATEVEKLNFLKSSLGKVLPIPLGSKLVVKKNAMILRGCLLLYNKDCTFIGGRIAELNQDYVKMRLRQIQQEMTKV